MTTKQGVDQIKEDEGFRKNIYRCTAGKLTVGYGYNLEANPQQLHWRQIADIKLNGITQDFAEQLLLAEIKDIENELHSKLVFWSKLSPTRKDVLINMAYNLGVPGLLKFKNTLQLLYHEKYKEAAEHMLDSLWAKQVPNRAKRLANQMRIGEY